MGNRFPWEEGFNKDWRARQPLLFPHSLGSTVEREFWAANDPASSLHDWKFDDAPHTGVFTTKAVMDGRDPITRVFHNIDDRTWEFHGPGESKTEDRAYVCFHHIIDKDPTLSELADLPMGWCAWKENDSGRWIRALTPADLDAEPPES